MSHPAENVTQLEHKPQTSFILVSPEMAKRWLKSNVKNRRLREADVRSYARDMTAGNWHLTGESIKFASDGSLLDGQHRLAAIIKSGVSVMLLVVRNVSKDAQTVMDTGRKRTASDALTIAGQAHTATLAAAVRLALGVEDGAPDPGRYEATHSEIAEWIDANPSIRMAAEFSKQVARRTDCPPAVVAYTFFVFNQIDPFEAANFWISAAEKVGLQSGDPVIALTNRFAESRRNRERLTKPMYLSLIFRAWNARRAGKPLRLLRVNSPTGGVVPIPAPR